MGDQATPLVTVTGADAAPVGEDRLPRRRRPRWVTLGAAGLALVGVLVLSGPGISDRLSADDADPIAPVLDLAPEVADPPLVVRRGGLVRPALAFEEASVLDGIVRDLHVTSDGRLLVVMQVGAGSELRSRIVETVDGARWNPILETDHLITTVTSKGRLVVAAGALLDPNGRTTVGWYGREPSEPVVWMSSDGTDWEQIGVVDPAGELSEVEILELVEWEDRYLLQGVRFPSQTIPLEQYVPGGVGDLVTSPHFQLNPVSGLEPRIDLVVFGTVVWSSSVSDLGIDIDAFEASLESSEPVLLTSDDLRQWSEVEVGSGDWIGEVVVSGDGSLFLTGWGDSGPRLWRSDDGEDWARLELTGLSDFARVSAWGDSMVAGASTAISMFDGTYWRPISPVDAIPPNQLDTSWTVTEIEVVDDALIGLATGYTWDSQPVDGNEVASFRSDDGHGVSVDVSSGTLEVDVAEGSVRVPLWSAPANAITLDPDSGQMSILDAGEVVARFPATRLIDALDSVWFGPQRVDTEIRVLYTTDRRRWHMGSVELRTAAAWFVGPRVATVGERLVVLVSEVDEIDYYTNRFSGDQTRVFSTPRP